MAAVLDGACQAEDGPWEKGGDWKGTVKDLMSPAKGSGLVLGFSGICSEGGRMFGKKLH